MQPSGSFQGFTPQCLRFFAQLRRNNNREWFAAHKDEYTRHVLEPARALVVDMAPALSRMCPGLVIDPTFNGSIFRIYRDTRFSNDKTPYKTHLGIYFWHTGGKKLERPGFYLEVDQDGLGLYCGWYVFQPGVLGAYRKAVADPIRGGQLLRILRKLDKAGIPIGGETYKRTPRGFEVDEARAPLLRHTGLYTEQPCGKPAVLFNRKLIDYCIRQWKQAMPLYRWLGELADPAGK